jgi:2-(1,2-epoxy-1,2-dihydrophenyl)acetyl-CoA isomerase
MSEIMIESVQGVARVTLNRPEALNAFAGGMRQELIDVLDRIATEENTRCVVLTGAGRGFCAGGDVKAMKSLQSEGDVEGFSRLLEAGKNIVMKIRQLPQPVIAMVNGVAAGAGCSLALACDYRVASTEAKFGQTFVRIGLHPDWGGTWFLPRLVGTSKAIEIAMTGRMVEAAEALQIGMIDRVVGAERLEEETMRIANAIAAGPPLAIREMKKAFYAAAANTLEEQLTLEASIQRRAFLSTDSREGIEALLEKRAAHFRGC